MATAFTYKPISWIFLRNSGLTISGQVQYFQIRGRGEVKNPRTEDQVTSRVYLTNAKRLWKTLSENDKKAWSVYARENIHTNKREQWHIGRGIDAFVRSSIARQTAGLDLLPGLPGDRSPSAPTALDLLPGSSARELVFRIEHKIADHSQHAMLVRMTPTGKSVACAPYKSSLRHVRGISQDSVIALPESGTVVRIPETRFALVPDHQYAVEVRIVRLADGTVSDPRYQAAVRDEATESNVAAIASVQTFQTRKKKSAPQGVGGVPVDPAALASAAAAQRKAPAVRDPETGRFVPAADADAAEEWVPDPRLSDEENAVHLMLMEENFGPGPKTRQETIAELLPPFIHLNEEPGEEVGEEPEEEVSQRSATEQCGERSRSHSDKESDADNAVLAAALTPKEAPHVSADSAAATPSEFVLPPLPAGRCAFEHAPGVTVPEDNMRMINLADSRGSKYFPSAYVQRRYFMARK